MPASCQTKDLSALHGEIESLLTELRHPILVEDEVPLMDLATAEWRLAPEFGKLIFTAWNGRKSIARRVEAIADLDWNRVRMLVRRRGANEATSLEIREQPVADSITRNEGRGWYRHRLLKFLEREYRGWKFGRVTNYSDREHSLSCWYTRGLARQGTSAWAFAGLGDHETPGAADSVLAFGLIWLDWLRSRSDHLTISHLKLFLPREAVKVIAHRAAFLNPRVAPVEIYEWHPWRLSATPVDLRDYGNVETRLASRRQGELLQESHRKLVAELLGAGANGIDVIPDASGLKSSLRVNGLEVSLIEGQSAPTVFFGLEGSLQRLDESNRSVFRKFVGEVARVRRARSPDPHHTYYRLQSERWLESNLYRDISRIDPELSGAHVYQQVPAFSARDRGVIDLLAATRAGRLAVIELKVHEEINLPLQGLDYWLRVNWLLGRGQFQEHGYFPGRELSSAPPLLYLVSPAFRFHSTTPQLAKYFHPRIETVLIGINENWRDGIKILYRHPMSRAIARNA
jgi:hypothetical protein